MKNGNLHLVARSAYEAFCKVVLGFKPNHDLESITEDLLANMDSFSDFDNPTYYNIEVFKHLVRSNTGRPKPAGA